MKMTSNSQLPAPPQQDQQAIDSTTFSTTSPLLYKDLSFPLNVYAHALWLQQGQAKHLHFGLFRQGTTDIQTAQQISTELIISRLPTSISRILEVGIGLGTTFSLLTQQGYDVQGITPDAQQITYVHKLLDEQVAISCQRFEDFKADAASFDAILFQESAQHIEPLLIFNQALELLDATGDLLIIDEFALARAEAGAERLHLLDDMVLLAERFGFELIEKLDLSSIAAPTLDHLLRMTTVYRQRLIKDLELSEKKLAQLDKSNLAQQKKYASGRYGYGLLHFRKKSTPKWRLQLLTKNQAPEMLALFETTFNHKMSPTTWHWKYGAEAGRGIGIWRKKHLVAHYGGIGRKILLFGQVQNAVQIGDVMVDARERSAFTKKGAFFQMAATYLERFIGYGKPYLLGFGFPNERAMKVAERHGLYAEIGRMTELSWAPLSKLPRWGAKLHSIGSMEDDGATIAVDECWQRMAEDLQAAIVGVRDSRYFQHRYFKHPSQHYQVVLVKNRFSGRARGVLVLRHDPNGCEIIDMIAPLAEIPLLIVHARRLAGIAGASRVFCRITENFASYFVAAGGTQQTLDIRIPTSKWRDGPKPEILKNRWWLMSGDMDFR